MDKTDVLMELSAAGRDDLSQWVNDNLHVAAPKDATSGLQKAHYDDKSIEQHLVEWETNDRDTGDDLHRYFEDEFGRWDWCEIYEEGIRINNLMFDDVVEDFSPLGNIFAAVAAQASHGAFAHIAACLGVDKDALRLAVSEWSEDQDNLPAPIGAERLLESCAKQAEWLREMNSTK